VKIKIHHIYQYQNVPKVVSKLKTSFSPIKTYLYAKHIKEGVAKCKVLLILEQPKEFKFKANSWVYVPVQNLITPDLFPKYNHQPARWLKYCSQPLVTSAIEILEELSPTLKTEIAASTNQLSKRDIKVGQKWETKTDTITIEKQWDAYFIVKNKYGDRDKYTPEELIEMLEKDGYKLSATFDSKALLKTVSMVLAPFFGAFALKALLSILSGFLK
jgi:hypothetical protein